MFYVSSEEEEEGESWPFYSVGGPHDVLVPRGEATREISELLGRVVHGRTEFSFGGRAYKIPDLPGLSVKDVGHVSLPLPVRDAEELMEKGEKVGGSTWVVAGDQVAMKNSRWAEGMQTLAKLSAGKLGFKGVALQLKLSRLVLYGEGGRTEKQRDTDESGRVVGTIVVQLPSKHAGGDLVVYEEGTKGKARYELGKVNGDAAFVPYYVVYAAGASWEVETVTSGFCLMVVCSLCLPPELPPMNGLDSGGFLRVQMAQAIKKMVTGKGDEQIEDKDENFEGGAQLRKVNGCDDWSDPDANKILALMLSKSVRPKDIEEEGIEALSGDDANRFQLMNAAIAALRAQQRLKCYIVCLEYCVSERYGAWEETKADQSASWYTVNGKKLSTDTPIKWTKKMDFVNPGKETLSELWTNEGSVLDEFERLAMVWWPNAADTSTLLALLGEDAAVISTLAENPVDPMKLQQVMIHKNKEAEPIPVNAGYTSYANWPSRYSKPEVSLTFCQDLCAAIGDLGDAALVDLFLKKYFTRLKTKRELAPTIVELVRKLSWEKVGTAILECIKLLPFQDGLGLALGLAEALSDIPAARTAVTTLVIQQASASSSSLKELALCDGVGLLWKLAVSSSDRRLFFDVEKLLKGLNGEALGHIVKTLAQCTDGTTFPEPYTTLVWLATRRCEWVANEVAEIEKPFTWEFRDANFPGAVELAKFLDSPGHCYRIDGFKGIADARARVETLLKTVKAPLRITASGRGQDAHVGVTKSGGEYDSRKENLPSYQEEIEMLRKLVISSKEKATMRDGLTLGKKTIKG